MRTIKRWWCRMFGHIATNVSLFRASFRGYVQCDRCGERIELEDVDWGND